MICVSKEYEIKTKMVQKKWLQLKKTFSFFLLRWIDFCWGGRNEQVLGWWGKMPPYPNRKYPIYINICIYIYIYIYMYIYIYILYILYIYIYKRTLPTSFYIQWRRSVYIRYIMCQSGHLNSARFEQFVCQRYIWYIFSLVCSVSII